MAEHLCSICLSGEATPLSSLPCGHVLHLSCVTQWLKVTGLCPDCRSACTQQDVVRLYLHPKTAVEVNKQLEEKYRTKSEQCEEAQETVKKQTLEIRALQRTHQAEVALLKDRVKVIPALKGELRNLRAEADDAKAQCKRWKAVADREASKGDVPERYGAGKDVFCGEAEAEKGERLRKIDARRGQSVSREAKGASTSGPEE